MRRTLKVTVDLDRKVTEISFEPVRPYYRRLARAVRQQLDIAERSEPAATDAITMLMELWQDVLLGTPRSVIRARNRANVPAPVREALNAEDTDAVERSRLPELHASISDLLRADNLAPPSQWQMGRSLQQSLAKGSDYLVRTLAAAYPRLGTTIYKALANSSGGDEPYAQFRSVHVLRRRSAVFGYNAPTVLFEDRPTDERFRPPVPAYAQEEKSRTPRHA